MRSWFISLISIRIVIGWTETVAESVSNWFSRKDMLCVWWHFKDIIPKQSNHRRAIHPNGTGRMSLSHLNTLLLSTERLYYYSKIIHNLTTPEECSKIFKNFIRSIWSTYTISKFRQFLWSLEWVPQILCALFQRIIFLRCQVIHIKMFNKKCPT